VIESSVASIMDRLAPDPWGRANGFSPEIADVHQAAWKASISDSEVSNLVAAWIRRFQPCIFGRLAASQANDFLSFCVLNDGDLRRPDTEIQEKIQEHRLDWW